jgi:hypothetical protein
LAGAWSGIGYEPAKRCADNCFDRVVAWSKGPRFARPADADPIGLPLRILF